MNDTASYSAGGRRSRDPRTRRAATSHGYCRPSRVTDVEIGYAVVFLLMSTPIPSSTMAVRTRTGVVDTGTPVGGGGGGTVPELVRLKVAVPLMPPAAADTT